MIHGGCYIIQPVPNIGCVAVGDLPVCCTIYLPRDRPQSNGSSSDLHGLPLSALLIRVRDVCAVAELRLARSAPYPAPLVALSLSQQDLDQLARGSYTGSASSVASLCLVPSVWLHNLLQCRYVHHLFAVPSNTCLPKADHSKEMSSASRAECASSG